MAQLGEEYQLAEAWEEGPVGEEGGPPAVGDPQGAGLGASCQGAYPWGEGGVGEGEEGLPEEVAVLSAVGVGHHQAGGGWVGAWGVEGGVVAGGWGRGGAGHLQGLGVGEWEGVGQRP